MTLESSSEVVSENTGSTQVCVTLSTTVNTRRTLAVQLTTEADTAIGELCYKTKLKLILPLSFLFFILNP